jgi:hypothetical protein
MGVTSTSDLALSSAAAGSAAWYAAELSGSAFLVDATNDASSDFLTYTSRLQYFLCTVQSANRIMKQQQ